MTTIAIDTLDFVRRLTDAGIPEKQADAHARAIKDVLSDQKLATRADLRELELRLDAKIATVKAEIATVKYDLLKWIVGLLIAQTALIFTVLPKLL
uniref:DUF1640 domain-containing protein n=2 Tax=unclassified Candidatus Kentrum TaxID=2643149 RepID=A0A451A9V0_9GAMM|nr:MAG: Protein of unknown function (DUF1640) [Candidatus Kentron sp. LPFa]VFK62789.1 MAG: Protein of unknown function (DUF1640) [Candidatus Kentron sp. UNK]VFK70641.1 MAG: Protein of unknown function (DUF1640) [Candidatus Kentron sp. UNK]